jgi:hypothetical protein
MLEVLTVCIVFGPVPDKLLAKFLSDFSGPKKQHIDNLLVGVIFCYAYTLYASYVPSYHCAVFNFWSVVKDQNTAKLGQRQMLEAMLDVYLHHVFCNSALSADSSRNFNTD